MKMKFTPAQTQVILEQLDAMYSAGDADLLHAFNLIFDLSRVLGVTVNVSSEYVSSMTEADSDSDIRDILDHFGYVGDYNTGLITAKGSRKMTNKFEAHTIDSRIRTGLQIGIAKGFTEQFAATYAALQLRAHIEGKSSGASMLTLLEDSIKWEKDGIPEDVVDYITHLGFMYDNGHIVLAPEKEVVNG